MTAALEVIRAGALTTVQDLGRRGFAHLGVSRSGALDPAAFRLGNRLVGNAPGSASLETTLDGVAFSLSVDRCVAVTGSAAPVSVDGVPVAWGLPFLLPRGSVVDVGRSIAGVRCYVAIAGGVLAEEVMGSRSTDLLSGVGPPPLAERARLPIGAVQGPPANVDFVPHSEPTPELHLACWLGPRDDELTSDALELVSSAIWTVTPVSNRIALRLDGPRLGRANDEELASEGLVTGSVQVPPDGQPVLFLADHPTTGGYPVVAVVPEPDVWRCAQSAPGTTIRFHPSRPKRPWAS